MPNYNEAQGVADLLSQLDFNIINERRGRLGRRECDRA